MDTLRQTIARKADEPEKTAEREERDEVAELEDLRGSFHLQAQVEKPVAISMFLEELRGLMMMMNTRSNNNFNKQ